METFKLILTIFDVIVCLVLVATVLFQSSKEEGVSSLFGGASETFFGKDKGRSIDSKLARATTVSAILFVVITFVVGVL